MNLARALFQKLGFCGLMVEALVFEVCSGDGVKAREKVVVAQGLKEGVTGDLPSCACIVEDGWWNNSEKDGTDCRGGETSILCSSRVQN